MFPEQTRFLVVDDFSSMRKIVQDCLIELGYNNIEEASDGAVAWAKLQMEEFGLVVCDWHMPEMTGLELLKKVRSDPKLKDLPFIIVTAEAEKENVFQAIKAGVNNYVVKPFSTGTLEEKIKQVYLRLK